MLNVSAYSPSSRYKLHYLKHTYVWIEMLEICEMSQIFKNLSQIDVAVNCTYISNTSHTYYCSKTFFKIFLKLLK
jgi:hypothetical protein